MGEVSIILAEQNYLPTPCQAFANTLSWGNYPSWHLFIFYLRSKGRNYLSYIFSKEKVYTIGAYTIDSFEGLLFVHLPRNDGKEEKWKKEALQSQNSRIMT
jgi:hypothetical protein